jgi:site-specific DNA recombinase
VKLAVPEQLDRPRAVSYLRVSTKEQAERDGDPEGFSIPAQRQANLRAAESLGADVVAEFVDRGESARSAARPELQRMLKFVEAEPISYCIVHKVDRLARNRVDDVEINLALTKAGARLISATENIDESPSGMLLHGIMSSIAEFYSRNLANEVIKGLSQKAKAGGTIARAPLGYLNIRTTDGEGREARTVVVDEHRAPLIAWAFERYANGDISIRRLALELEVRGLTSRSTPKRPSRAIYANQLHKMFLNPYYKGEVHFQGVSFVGRHTPLVSETIWQKVQDTMAAHVVGEKIRSHPHFLNGTVFCGHCGSRLGVQHSRNRYGVIYEYFICSGRHTRRNGCPQGAILIEEIERRVVDLYRATALSSSERDTVESILSNLLAATINEIQATNRKLQTEHSRLKDRQRKLLEAHYANAVPLDLMRSEQEQIGVQLVSIEERLSRGQLQVDDVHTNLLFALNIAEVCFDAYQRAPSHVRRLMNQAFFTHIFVTDEGIRPEMTAPMAVVRHNSLRANLHQPSEKFNDRIRMEIPQATDDNTVEYQEPRPRFLSGRGSDNKYMVDPRRFELLTSSMRTRRATNCAKGPFAA